MGHLHIRVGECRTIDAGVLQERRAAQEVEAWISDGYLPGLDIPFFDLLLRTALSVTVVLGVDRRDHHPFVSACYVEVFLGLGLCLQRKCVRSSDY